MRSVHTGMAAVLTLALVLALPGAAVAEREYDFAKALWRAGYRDLAIQQYRRLLALEGASADENARAHFDLAAIYQEEADQAAGAAGRQSLLRKAEAELALALKEAGADVVLVFAARQQQALLLQNNARHLAALLDRSDFAGDRTATTAEAVRAFDQSVAAFQALAKDAEALISRIEKEAKQGYRQVAVRLQNERVNAGLRALWSTYYAGLLFEKDAPARRERLEKARDGFSQFAKEWDGYVVSLYGHLGEGACRLALGDHQKAQAKFTLVIAAARTRPTREVRVQALIHRATSFNATDQSQRAMEDLETALRSFRQPERVELGRQALVEKAKALANLAEQMRAARPGAREWQGLVRQALQAARGVAERPGPYAGEAIRLITRLLGAVDVTQAAASPAEAIAVAQSAMRGKRYEEAVAGYQQAIRLSPRPDAPAAVRAWFGIGRCHYYLKHYREAAIVFEHVGRSFPASADGPRAAYLAVQCWMTAQAQSRHEAERRAGMRSLTAALEQYGNDPRIGELRVLRGQLLQREGQYEAALQAYQAVPEGAAGYARAQYEAGLCAYDWFINLFRRNVLGGEGGKAQYGAAVAHLKAYLALVKDARGEEERERIGTARLVLATIHNDLLGDAKSALGFLDFAFPADQSAKVLPLRLKALIQEQRVEEALAVLKEVRASAKADPKRLQEALQQLGAALDQQAEALRKKGDRDAYLAAAKRTAEFLVGVLKENPDQDAEMYGFVASRLIRIERFGDASEVLKQLIQRFAADPKNKAVVLSARLSLVECSMGTDAWREAIEQLHALQKTYPGSARLKMLLATCYVESGQRDKGIPILQNLFRSVYRGGTRPWYEAGLALARAHEKAGRKDRVLAVTSHVRLLYAPFWNGRDTENLDLAEQYKEVHKRCGGT